MTLQTPLNEVKGIGPKFCEKLKKLKIETVKSLLWHFPFRYEDFSNIVAIKDLKVGERATIQGVIQSIKLRRTWKRKMFIIEALISDKTGSIRAIWFNQKFLITMLKKNSLVNLAGKISESQDHGLVMSHPIHEILTYKKNAEDLRHTGRVVPVYPETKGITSKGIRYLIKPLIDKIEKIEEPLPEEILKKYEILGIDSAIKLVHFPEKIEDAISAKKRFAFEDLFFLSLVNIRQRIKLDKEKAYSSGFELDDIKELLAKLPFELTYSQKKSLWEILQDIKKSHPMNRLLQGDVGSGKTIVAILTALVLAKDGKQSAFMAPTEVLARQHFETFKKFFADFDKSAGLITGSMAKVFYGDGLENDLKKNDLVKKVGNNEIKIVFGTHALIQKYVKFSDLALVIIDEQHRFGVRQRAELFKNHCSKETLPHLLSMSATPIPRTLTLAIFGDLDLSIIDELPKNRKAIITKIVNPKNRDKAYAFIRGQVKKGRQVFVICPRIEPTSESQEIANQGTAELIKKSFFNNWDNVKMVKEEYEKLSKKIFPDLRVSMLHGKMKAKEKNETMARFNNCETDVLVSTSVIEVGVDVPNAVIMMIEDADKFGLAQLYQFRGRVGRGEHQSFCLLLTESSSKTVYERLRSLIDAKNGFELAEKDLAIRGPGEFLGNSTGWAQTGVPDMAMKAIKNPNLVKDSRKAAEELLLNDSELEKYPLIKKNLENFQQEVHLE
ncbi:ATP-dependent DNA helicase RecG [Candidatus Wolfebacteria bacterium]|nr:ATP-dependent DNA helicase RecG [Candidatus Wolfebacteria bacterium]